VEIQAKIRLAQILRQKSPGRFFLWEFLSSAQYLAHSREKSFTTAGNFRDVAERDKIVFNPGFDSKTHVYSRLRNRTKRE
jgi:hypothetical protein